MVNRPDLFRRWLFIKWIYTCKTGGFWYIVGLLLNVILLRFLRTNGWHDDLCQGGLSCQFFSFVDWLRPNVETIFFSRIFDFFLHFIILLVVPAWYNCTLPLGHVRSSTIIAIFVNCMLQIRPFPSTKPSAGRHTCTAIKLRKTSTHKTGGFLIHKKPLKRTSVAYQTANSNRLWWAPTEVCPTILFVYNNCVTRSFHIRQPMPASPTQYREKKWSKKSEVQKRRPTQFFCPFGCPETTLLYDTHDCQTLCRSTAPERFGHSESHSWPTHKTKPTPKPDRKKKLGFLLSVRRIRWWNGRMQRCHRIPRSQNAATPNLKQHLWLCKMLHKKRISAFSVLTNKTIALCCCARSPKHLTTHPFLRLCVYDNGVKQKRFFFTTKRNEFEHFLVVFFLFRSSPSTLTVPFTCCVWTINRQPNQLWSFFCYYKILIFIMFSLDFWTFHIFIWARECVSISLPIRCPSTSCLNRNNKIVLLICFYFLVSLGVAGRSSRSPRIE